MKIKPRSFLLLVGGLSLFLLCFLHAFAQAREFADLSDYQNWAVNTGRPSGLLISMGVDGINQDIFHSNPNTPGYASGKIVIGDSRSCQLGILQNRTGAGDFAAFAVWGGHYVPGPWSPILSGGILSEIEQCFHEQIKTVGNCTVYFFATVNDYDYLYNNNAGCISAAIASAETVASMSYEYEGTVYHPEVIMIGFAGGNFSSDSYGMQQGDFNQYIDAYNSALRDAVNHSALLKETAAKFTTISQITGGNTTFISDGLHYSDNTLQMICDFIKNNR